MLTRLLIVAVTVIGLYFLIRWWHRSKSGTHGLYVVATVVSISALLLLAVIRGGAEASMLLITISIPFLARWLKVGRSPSATRSKSESSNNSEADSWNMNRAEAYQILGLQSNASNDEIQAAYRRLIQRVHPDQGGSSYLAACLNKARKLLLD